MIETQRPVWMEVDLEAVERNYLEAVRRAGPTRRVIAAIKANAYGHGVTEVANTLNRHGVFAFWTGNVGEAVALRHGGVNSKIIMFGGYLPDTIADLVRDNLVPTIYDEVGAASASRAAQHSPLSVYVKVDAGLGRLGVPVAEAREFIGKISKIPSLHLEGVYAHLPFGDLAGKRWALECYAKFETLLSGLKQDGINPEITQVWGSSGLLADLADCTNSVCVGHLIYGLSPVQMEVARADGFQPACTAIKGNLIHVGHYAVGADLAVGSQYRIKNAKVTGVLALGVGDGMRRPVSGATIEVLISGKRVPVIGTSLEHTVLDLSGVDSPRVGDEVVLVGECGGERISLADWGRWFGCSELDVVINFGGRLIYRYVNPADDIWQRFGSEHKQAARA